MTHRTEGQDPEKEGHSGPSTATSQGFVDGLAGPLRVQKKWAFFTYEL